MRVLMLDPSDGNPYAPDLASALYASGVDVRLLVPIGFTNASRTSCPYEEVAPRGGRGRHLMKAADELGYVRRIASLVRSWTPNVIHVQWVRLRFEARVLQLLRRMGPRVVVTAHNVVPHELGFGDRRFYASLYRSADRIIAHETRAKERLGIELGVDLTRIDVVPAGLPPSPRPMTKESARAALGLGSCDVVFLFFGALRSYKGYEMLVRAFDRIVEQGFNVRLILSGWGQRHAVFALYDLISSLSLRTQSLIHVWVGEDRPVPSEIVDQVFAACDCVVLPYSEISHSSVLFQAFTNGRAVLTSDIGGFAEWVDPQINGRTVSPLTEKSLGNALAQLARDPPQLEQWGSQAKRWAETHFSWQRVVRETSETYAKACGN